MTNPHVGVMKSALYSTSSFCVHTALCVVMMQFQACVPLFEKCLFADCLNTYGTVVKITWLCACPISTVEVAGLVM